MNGILIAFKNHKKSFLLILAVLTFSYGPSLKNGFVWDDYLSIADNHFIKSFDNLPLIFSKKYFTPPSALPQLQYKDIGAGELSYRPVVTLTYFLDFRLWHLNAFGYHLTNLLLHLINILLVYGLALTINNKRRFATTAALIFAVHPVQAEAVLTPAFREDLLACFFMLLSLLLYLRARAAARPWTWHAASALSYLLALFAKEIAITLPVLAAVYEYVFIFKDDVTSWRKGLLQRYAGFITATVFYLWVWLFVFPRVGSAGITYPGGSFYLNVLTMLKVFAGYIAWFVIPLGIHPTMRETSFFAKTFWDPVVLISATTIAACLGLAWICRKQRRLLTFAVLWFFIALSPAANIIPIENIMAARYLYVPIIGLCLAAAFLLEEAWTKNRTFSPAALRTLSVGILVFCVLQVWTQSLHWTNEISFRKTMLEYYPHNVRAYRSLAGAYGRFHRYKEAVLYTQKAQALAPKMVENYLDLAVLYREMGKDVKAAAELKKARTLQGH